MAKTESSRTPNKGGLILPDIGVMKLTTLRLPMRWIRDLDQLVKEKRYANRADAIRAGVRDLLANEVWRRQK